MRILVLSDSHGSRSSLYRAISDHPEVKDVIFLGDGENDIEEMTYAFPDIRFYIICGNCDFCSVKPLHDIFMIGGKKIFACHGHTYNVKYGYDEVINAAKTENADIVLFGHTHVAYTSYSDGLYIMNPGSVSRPKDFGGGSYGYIDILPNGILTGIIR